MKKMNKVGGLVGGTANNLSGSSLNLSPVKRSEKQLHRRLPLREDFGATEVVTKNQHIEYTILNIHDKRSDEETLKKNQRQLNEILTRTLYEAQQNLADLTSLTKRKLGPKALLYQQHTIDDNDPFSALGAEGGDGAEVSNYDDDDGKNDKSSEEYVGSPTSFIKKNITSAKITSLNENLMLNQLIDLVDQKKKEKLQLGIFDNSLREIFLRTRGLIENLWEEMNIEDLERRDFSKKHFYPETLLNYVTIFKEITRLTGVRSVQHSVLTSLEQREVYIKRLKEIAMQFNGYRSGNSSLMGRLQDPLIKNEVPTIVSNLRSVTIELVESVLLWRSQLTKKTVFLYNGENYMVKMRNDLDFLKLTELAPLFEIVGITLDSNPLLLSEDIRHSGQQSFQDYVEDMIQSEGSTSLKSKNQSATSIVQTYQTKRDHEKKQSRRLTEDTSLQAIPRVLKMNLSFANMERLREADRIISQEDMYIKYLEERALRDRAATKIQCQWRSFMARNYMKRLRDETRKAAKYTNSLNKQAGPTKVTNVTNNSYFISTNVDSLTTKDLMEELEKSRKDDILLNSLKISGRYSSSIFDY